MKAFRRLEGATQQRYLVRPSRTVRLGEPQCYAFCANGDTWFGDLPEISETLRDFAEIWSGNLSLRLQIFELIGSRTECAKARSELEKSIAHSLGPRASRLFHNAALRAELWKLLVKSAPNGSEARNILRNRSRLSAWLEADGNVALDLSCLDEGEAGWVNRESLVAALGTCFET